MTKIVAKNHIPAPKDNGNPASSQPDKKVRASASPGEATVKIADPGTQTSAPALVPAANGRSPSRPADSLGPARFDWENGELKPSTPSCGDDLLRTFGTENREIAEDLFFQVKNTAGRSGSFTSTNAALAQIYEIAPKDPTERIIAVQLNAVHAVAMDRLAKAAKPSQSVQQSEAHLNASMKLLRMSTTLIEALDRHRGKVPQPIVVGNVNVHDGGQAIVGRVNHSGSGKAHEDGDDEKTVEKPKRP